MGNEGNDDLDDDGEDVDDDHDDDHDDDDDLSEYDDVEYDDDDGSNFKPNASNPFQLRKISTNRELFCDVKL